MLRKRKVRNDEAGRWSGFEKSSFVSANQSPLRRLTAGNPVVKTIVARPQPAQTGSFFGKCNEIENQLSNIVSVLPDLGNILKHSSLTKYNRPPSGRKESQLLPSTRLVISSHVHAS